MGEVYVNINGVQRRAINTYANINGVWRHASQYANIDGVYREIDDFSITESKIIGFRFAYVSDHNATYANLPNLKYNPSIPAQLSLTGMNAKAMDTATKGVMLQYHNTLEPDQLDDKDDQEGILMYRLHVYAILANGLIVDVTATNDIVGWESRHPVHALPGMVESWNINRMNNLHIQIYSKMGYVINGIHTEGWNRIFTSNNYIGSLRPGHEREEFQLPPEHTNILPIDTRPDDFFCFAEIGIARDLHTYGKNMVGSYGQFTHSFIKVSVNGIDKPFSMEIYE